MQIRRMVLGAAAIVLMVVAGSERCLAISYSSVVVLGDSLSDNGNLYALSGDTVPLSPPYYAGRYSNGPVAVEQLAGILGAPLLDVALAGATTGVGNIGDGGTQTAVGSLHLPGMETLLATLGPLPPAFASSSLFVVWGGANDFEGGGSASVAAGNILGIVATLEAEGASIFLFRDFRTWG